MDTSNNHLPHSHGGLSQTETEQLLEALAAIRQGDFTAQLPEDSAGAGGDVARSFNALCEQLQSFAVESSRLAAAIGAEGQLGAQMPGAEAGGTWKDLTENLNHMSLILATQVRDVARVAAIVAEGDLSQKVTVAAGGEMAELKDSFNAMIDQLQLLKESVSKLMKRVNEMGTPSKQNGHPG